MTTRRRATGLLVAALGLSPFMAGCHAADLPESSTTIGRDSAGVRIVENGSAVGWSGGREPQVRVDPEIGSAHGDGPDVFGNVVALDVDAAGRIHLLDQQAGNVVVFDAQGRHERTFGRPGSGPGELSPGASAVFVGAEGSVTVSDLGNARVTRYAPDASVTSWLIRLARGVPVRWDRLGDGTHVAQLRAMAVDPSVEPTDVIVRYGPDGAVLDTLISLPAGASVTVGPDGLPAISVFEAEPLWDVAVDGTLTWAMNSSYEIRRHAAGGDLVAVIRRDVARRPVTQQDRVVVTGLVRDMMLDQGVPPARVETITDRMRIAEWFPALASVHAAPDGRIWVQQVRLPGEGDGARSLDPMDLGSPDWDVFDQGGRWLGTVRLPDRFTMMAVREGALYGALRDELDVQSVVRLSIGPG